ncbi:hypothetical protein QFC19_006780 [Naganishia cerealis]|uniref:Uncharacterized protein n=1 Tax=Naganishia cerealis TaxID=610337 RepID=A0ACC2VEP4_9TREE|nr:hypothetical protein QFC19_006780 [Naganishia cerealis]
MSGAGYAVVDADDDQFARAGKPGGLEFQNFLSVDEPAPAVSSGRTSPNRTVPADNQSLSTAPFSPFNLTYYQSYFNITTPTITHRLIQSLLPRPNFLHETCDGNVDLYGPFWTLTTLILTIYLSTSLSASISASLSSSPDTGNDSNQTKQQDLTLLSVAITLIYTYGLAFPTLIWAASRWFSRGAAAGNGFTTTGGGEGLLGSSTAGNTAQQGTVGMMTAGEWRLVDALAIWGYAMVIYVPVSVSYTPPLTCRVFSPAFYVSRFFC